MTRFQQAAGVAGSQIEVEFRSGEVEKPGRAIGRAIDGQDIGVTGRARRKMAACGEGDRVGSGGVDIAVATQDRAGCDGDAAPFRYPTFPPVHREPC